MKAQYLGYFSITNISNGERIKIILILIVILAFILISVYFNPLKFIMNDVIGVKSPNGCPMLTFTNIPCPTCGMGRAFSCLIDGNIRGSIYRNPLFILFISVFILIYALIFTLALMKRKIVILEKSSRMWFIPFIFILIIWITNIMFGNHH